MKMNVSVVADENEMRDPGKDVAASRHRPSAAPSIYGYARIESPLGRIEALARDGKLCALRIERGAPRRSSPLAQIASLEVCPDRNPAGVATALEAYFEGKLDALDAIEVAPQGTDFQKRVWQALRKIPAGETTSYGVLAAKLGVPSAARAVGAANGANPIWLVVPCHRVIGASGNLTGYAGGLDVKRWLLAHEQRHSSFALR
jgi:methylated-DNA-[protein]-cysteine S-methyltransferase